MLRVAALSCNKREGLGVSMGTAKDVQVLPNLGLLAYSRHDQQADRQGHG